MQAKSGHVVPATEIASSLTNDQKVYAILNVLKGRRPIIVPIIAKEATGDNKLPLGYAAILSNKLKCRVSTDIIQSTRAYHTKAKAFHRIAINPAFEGKVIANQEYLVVDDTITMGGTVAFIKGYIENNGGKVILATALTGFEQGANIKIKDDMVSTIYAKHGAALEDYLQEEFGYGINKLTQGEAGHIRATPDVDTLRERINEAKRKAGFAIYSKNNQS